LYLALPLKEQFLFLALALKVHFVDAADNRNKKKMIKVENKIDFIKCF